MAAKASASISFEKCEQFVKEMKLTLKSLMQSLEEVIITGKDEENIPIYLTKCRIKNPESVFLKIKRKKKSLKEIQDYAGLRRLWLFEKDIFEVHKFILRKLKKQGDILEEFKMFNWQENDEDLFKAEAKRTFLHFDFDNSKKKSGYKSIHYIVKIIKSGKSYYVEIQLRTLLQDVWGELEHSLSYKKGTIHPHIKTGFHLLARDLETNDNLLTDLRNTSDKQNSAEAFFNENYTPRNYFDYEEAISPKVFLGHDKLKGLFEKYNNFMKDVDLGDNRDWVPKARACYKKIVDSLSYGANEETRYWADMENAFLCFFENRIDKSFDIYQKLKTEKNFKDRYVLFFRMGEIYFSKNDVVKALNCFDESERLLSKDDKASKGNRYWIKLRLALIYWSLGPDYIDITLEEINEAERIFLQNKTLFGKMYEKYENALINNVCWYYLVKYIISKEDGESTSDLHYSKAKEKFTELLKVLEKKSPSRNMLDTAAWFCYQTYKRNKKGMYLENAKKYCRQMRDKNLHTSFNHSSIEIQMNHIQEIMSAV
jgi:ppGpp synthetase/RelA/SpoT-type nucleotidyltranferase